MMRPLDSAHRPRWRRGVPLCVLVLLALPGCATRSKGMPWTILCLEVKGTYARPHVEQIAETLKRSAGIRAEDVFFSHDRDGASRLYYGRYFRRLDPKTGKRPIPRRLQEDLTFIKQLGAGPEQYLFLGAMMVPLPVADVGDPDWELSRNPGVYSLQVAVFEPTDHFWNFKQAAADYCAVLRKEGHEAYYHHGRATSEVTVGSFGEDALITPERGLPWYAPDVLKLQGSDELFQYNLLNGRIYRARNDQGQMVPVPSRLVRVPKEQ